MANVTSESEWELISNSSTETYWPDTESEGHVEASSESPTPLPIDSNGDMEESPEIGMRPFDTASDTGATVDSEERDHSEEWVDKPIDGETSSALPQPQPQIAETEDDNVTLRYSDHILDHPASPPLFSVVSSGRESPKTRALKSAALRRNRGHPTSLHDPVPDWPAKIHNIQTSLEKALINIEYLSRSPVTHSQWVDVMDTFGSIVLQSISLRFIVHSETYDFTAFDSVLSKAIDCLDVLRQIELEERRTPKESTNETLRRREDHIGYPKIKNPWTLGKILVSRTLADTITHLNEVTKLQSHCFSSLVESCHHQPVPLSEMFWHTGICHDQDIHEPTSREALMHRLKNSLQDILTDDPERPRGKYLDRSWSDIRSYMNSGYDMTQTPLRPKMEFLAELYKNHDMLLGNADSQIMQGTMQETLCRSEEGHGSFETVTKFLRDFSSLGYCYHHSISGTCCDPSDASHYRSRSEYFWWLYPDRTHRCRLQ